MEDIDIRQPQRARGTGEVVLRFTGRVEKNELREGLKAAGPSLYVVAGRTRLRSWMMVLPKRLMTAPDAELLGAVLDSRLRRG
ncbi:hypothetical protein [Streptomyces yangpuensis]|uniref:hypothetical protein n=1 Tax=Streptomyces yangpuensis TaxID=1648182 RepID=UPI00382FBB58